MKQQYLIMNLWKTETTYVSQLYDNGKECKTSKKIKDALLFDDYEKAVKTLIRLDLCSFKVISITDALIIEARLYKGVSQNEK